MIRMYEARDSKDKNWYSFDNLIDMYDEDPINYKYVSQRLECPCCGEKIVTCKIDDDSSELFSKRSEHKKNCDYYGFKLSQNKVKQQLNSDYDFAKEYHGVIHGHPETNKAIGRRNIERLLSDDDFMVTKMFYGQVQIRTAHSKDEERYINYSVKAPKGDAITLSFQKSVFESLEQEMLFLKGNVNKECYILFIGSINKYDDYRNIVIERPNQLVIRELYMKK